MRFTSKDTFGFLLVGGTLGALYLHNASSHQDTHTAATDMGVDATAAVSALVDVTAPSPDPSLLAFVDVNVLPMTGDEVLHRQVVVMRDGVVTAMGPVGSVEAPAQARVVQGNGSSYLVPGFVPVLAELYDTELDSDVSSGTIETGARADLVLVDADPRVDVQTLRRPRGAVAKGAWYGQGELTRLLLADGGRP